MSYAIRASVPGGQVPRGFDSRFVPLNLRLEMMGEGLLSLPPGPGGIFVIAVATHLKVVYSCI